MIRILAANPISVKGRSLFHRSRMNDRMMGVTNRTIIRCVRLSKYVAASCAFNAESKPTAANGRTMMTSNNTLRIISDVDSGGARA